MVPLLSIWPARPAAYSDESTLNETWSSYRRRASGLLLEGSNGRSDNLCNGPVAALCRIERDTTPSTPSSRGKKAPAPDSTGRFAHRNSKEYKADVAKGCEQFDDLQELLEKYNAYRTVWKSNWRHFSIDATPARWRGAVAPLVMCARVMCTCAPYWKTPSGAGKRVASSALVYAT